MNLFLILSQPVKEWHETEAVVETADSAQFNLIKKECVFCGWRSQLWKEKEIENRFLGHIKINLTSAFLFLWDDFLIALFPISDSKIRDILQIQHIITGIS